MALEAAGGRGGAALGAGVDALERLDPLGDRGGEGFGVAAVGAVELGDQALEGELGEGAAGLVGGGEPEQGEAAVEVFDLEGQLEVADVEAALVFGVGVAPNVGEGVDLSGGLSVGAVVAKQRAEDGASGAGAELQHGVVGGVAHDPLLDFDRERELHGQDDQDRHDQEAQQQRGAAARAGEGAEAGRGGRGEAEHERETCEGAGGFSRVRSAVRH